MFDSVRTRLTLWYVGVLALVLIAFSFGVHALLARSLHQRLDAGLRSIVESAAVSLVREIEEGETHHEAATSTVTELFFPHQALAIFDAEGRLMAERPAQDNTRAQLPDLNLINQSIHLFTAKEEGDDSDGRRVAVNRFTIPAPGTTYIIAVSQSLETVSEELELLRHVFFFAVPVALAFAGLGGWFLARNSLRPVVAMSEQARRIGAENLDQRLPITNPRDELGRLASTFNELLARLSTAFAQQRQFMADASHELRTPLSVVHTAACVTLERKQRSEGEYRDALRIIDEQTRRLTRIVTDMFTLVRADAGRQPLCRSQFYLDELLAETARAAEVLAIPKGVRIEVTSPSEAPCCGDEDLLRRMILNLLDNAIKYTSSGGRVGLSLARQGETYVVRVVDTGPGIPRDAQPHIFERFYRVDKARSHSNGNGSGLGLAIARWVAEAHTGQLELEHSDEKGTTFVAVLPLNGS